MLTDTTPPTKKQHHLAGVVHTGSLDGRKVATTWTTTRREAGVQAEAFRTEGAALSRIFTDGRAGFRIVGYF
jgi:hypothetical protein